MSEESEAGDVPATGYVYEELEEEEEPEAPDQQLMEVDGRFTCQELARKSLTER